MGELLATLQVGGWGVAAVTLWALSKVHAQLMARIESKDVEIARLNEARVADEKDVRTLSMAIVEKQSTTLAQVNDVMREVARAR